MTDDNWDPAEYARSVQRTDAIIDYVVTAIAFALILWMVL